MQLLNLESINIKIQLKDQNSNQTLQLSKMSFLSHRVKCIRAEAPAKSNESVLQ